MAAWSARFGILRDDYTPEPAFTALQHLIARTASREITHRSRQRVRILPLGEFVLKVAEPLTDPVDGVPAQDKAKVAGVVMIPE